MAQKKQKKLKRWDALAAYIPKDRHFLMAEVGVESGKTTTRLLQKYPKLKIIAVDRWCVTPPGDSYFEGSRVMSRWDAQTWKNVRKKFLAGVAPFRKQIIVIEEDSVKAADKVKDGTLDLVFIDANHEYLATKIDIETWLPKVKPGGIISGHDYANENTFGNVKKAVDEIFGDDIILSHDHTWFYRVPE